MALRLHVVTRSRGCVGESFEAMVWQ